MKRDAPRSPSATSVVAVLRHIETGEFVCLRQNSKEFVACFTDNDSAFQFRGELGLTEFVDILSMRIGDTPFDNFWLDGEMLGRNMLRQSVDPRP